MHSLQRSVRSGRRHFKISRPRAPRLSQPELGTADGTVLTGSGHNRTTPFTTTVSFSSSAPSLKETAVAAQQWKMNASRSVTQTVLAELAGKEGTLIHDDGLPYDFGRMLTPAGRAYAGRHSCIFSCSFPWDFLSIFGADLELPEDPENLERYWQLQADSFKPEPFEGKIQNGVIELKVTAPSVTVIHIGGKH
jgi:hypothetical protein